MNVPVNLREVVLKAKPEALLSLGEVECAAAG
ncbi:hypothetical protein N5P32_10375 [Marinomonas pontica]|nr:hypothetical protein [Marinomonas pontica]